jgi:hypothetical protein
MKKLILIITINLLCSLIAVGQKLFFIGDNSYPRTDSYSFSFENYFIESLDIFFSKNGNNNMIVLTYEDSDGGEDRVIGTIKIYLDNATVINCIDKGKYDYVNKKSTTIYYLTQDEVDKIKKSDINTIRFSIGSISFFDNKIYKSDFTVENNRYNFSTIVNDFFK